MGVRNFQQILDCGGTLELGPGVHRPDLPLFLGEGGTVVGRPDAVLNCWDCGTAVVAGWPRKDAAGNPAVSASHFSGDTYRTRIGTADTYLRCNGTPWDLGPSDGWPAVTKLVVEAKLARHDPASWAGLGVAGVQATGPAFGPYPSPWLLYWDGAVLTLAVTTSDGVLRKFRFPGFDPAAPDLNVRVYLDLAAGTCTADDWSGAPAAADGSQAGAGWGPGLSLCDNELWPFSLGRIDPFCSADGYWPGGWPDLTVASFAAVTTSGVGQTRCYTAGGGGPVVPYAGSAPLPLFRSYCDRTGVVWLYAARRGLGNASILPSAGDIRLDGLHVEADSFAGNPNVVLGFVQGGFSLSGGSLRGGTRGLSCSQAGVVYPVAATGTKFQGHSDGNLFLYRSGFTSVRDCQMHYGRRRSAILVGCNGVVSGVMVAPPGPPPQGAVVEQRGGSMVYEALRANYEYTPGPQALVRLTPESWDLGWFASGARLVECDGGNGPGSRPPQVFVRTRAPGYTAPVRVVVANADTQDLTVAGPGASDPTVQVVVNGLVATGDT